jgi:hypothetical protein
MALPIPQEHLVLAMLSLPRGSAEIARLLSADPNAPFEPGLPIADLTDQADAILASLAEQDYARNLGVHDTPEAILSFLADDDSLVPMPDEKGEQFLDSRNGSDAYKMREGDLWYWTVVGRVALLG